MNKVRNSFVVALLIWILLPCNLKGQVVKPAWMDDDLRTTEFPPDEWYIDLVVIDIGNGSLENAVNRAKQAAIGGVSSKIRSDVDSRRTSLNVSESRITPDSEDERINSLFVSSIQTVSKTQITNVEVTTYHSKAENTMYAFAYIKRQDLVNYYQAQISLWMSQLNSAIKMAQQIEQAGKKIKARKECENAIPLLAKMLFAQDLLTAVDKNATGSRLQLQRSEELRNEIAQTLIRLEQSTFVYVDCQYEYKGDKNDAFSSDPNIICDIVKQVLSENDCSVVDDEAEADYTLTLTASTTQRSDKKGQVGIISYYANVKGTLYNRMMKKKTVDFSILNDPDAYAAGKSPEDAASKAFKLPALKEKVLEKILQKIKN
jgi:hypothetical protein